MLQPFVSPPPLLSSNAHLGLVLIVHVRDDAAELLGHVVALLVMRVVLLFNALERRLARSSSSSSSTPTTSIGTREEKKSGQ